MAVQLNVDRCEPTHLYLAALSFPWHPTTPLATSLQGQCHKDIPNGDDSIKVPEILHSPHQLHKYWKMPISSPQRKMTRRTGPAGVRSSQNLYIFLANLLGRHSVDRLLGFLQRHAQAVRCKGCQGARDCIARRRNTWIYPVCPALPILHSGQS